LRDTHTHITVTSPHSPIKDGRTRKNATMTISILMLSGLYDLYFDLEIVQCLNLYLLSRVIVHNCQYQLYKRIKHTETEHNGGNALHCTHLG